MNIKIIKKIVSISLQSILFVLLLLSVITFVSSRTSVLGSLRSMVVLTGSMEPALPVGSVIYIQKQLAYDKGNIITFKDPQGTSITHRIVDIDFSDKGTVYKTKGDANNETDTTLISSANVTGRVFFTLPYVGKFVTFLTTPLGFISLVILPAFFVIVMELVNIKRELEKEIEKKLLHKLQNSVS